MSELKHSNFKSVGSTKQSQKNQYWYRTVEFENGDKGSLGSKEENPSWLGVGKPFWYKVVPSEYGDRITREKDPNSQQQQAYSQGKKSGGWKNEMEFKEVIHMCRSNAVGAMAKINADYGKEVMSAAGLKTIEQFTQGSISGNIEKWKDEHNLLISRMESVNNASTMAKVKQIKSAEALVGLAENLYKYVTK